MAKNVINVPNSKDCYSRLKTITDAAQSGTLNPWSPWVVNLFEEYGVKTERLKDMRVQANLSFPTSTPNRSIAIGFRHLKAGGSFAEDLFVAEEAIGLTCYYRGAQEKYLPEYKGSHHAAVMLSEFLPELKQEMSSIRLEMAKLARPVSVNNIEIVTDADYIRERQILHDEQRSLVRSTLSITNGAAVGAINEAARIETRKKMDYLSARKARSDRYYDIELAEINDQYDDEVERAKALLNTRGMLHSGATQLELERLEKKRGREILKLKMKYGKEMLV
jgi:hypothetical protein